MRTSITTGSDSRFRSGVARNTGRVLVGVVRAPLVIVLALLEPVVRAICGFALVIGVLVAIVFELSAVGPRFPFLWMIGMSLAFGLVLVLYEGLLGLLLD